METNNTYDNLYDYYLHYNIYTQEWNAILRKDAVLYMNGDTDIVIFSSESIDKLIEKICEK